VSGRLQYPPSSDIIQGYGQAAPPSQLIGQFSSTNQGSTSGLRASSQFGLGRLTIFCLLKMFGNPPTKTKKFEKS